MMWGQFGPAKPPCPCGCHTDGTPELKACSPCCTTPPAGVQSSASEPIPTEHVKGPPGDHDTAYTYSKPTSLWPRPFNAREFAKLLILRGRVRAERDT